MRDAAFGCANAFTAHVNVGLVHGAELTEARRSS
jgi:hypothetical protein